MLRSLFGWVKERSGRPTSDETASVDMRLEETRARSVAPALAQAIETRPEARFETRNVIGAGGMGTVVRVLDRNLGREVAMKIIAPERALDPGEGEAFVFEARVTAQLEHPNVIPVHDLGVDEEGRAYFVMRMVDGTTLQQRVQRPGDERPLEERLHELLLILLKVCDAVSFAHSRGVIHLDLKPQNIMTGPFGEVYVLDWGVARWKAAAAPPPEPRAEGEQECVGTPAYMAPEQARGEAAALDERTDVFGLGAVLYYVLVGRAPFNADSADASLALARACRFQDPQEVAGGVLPTALCEIARRALSSDPARRYASVAEMRQALERSLRGGLGAVVRTFAPGAVIVAEGEPGDAAFIITAAAAPTRRSAAFGTSFARWGRGRCSGRSP
jgi:serine/threonine-protein kinase